MLRLSKFVVVVILGGCHGFETVTNHHELENNTYDPWSFPKCKKLFEINIK